MLEEESKKHTLSVLETAEKIIDKNFNEIDNFITQMAFDNKIQKFSYADYPLQNKKYYDVFDLTNTLYPYNLLNSYVDDFYIFFRKSRSVISKGIYYDFDYFYPNYIDYNEQRISALFRNVLIGNANAIMLPACTIRKGNKPKFRKKLA